MAFTTALYYPWQDVNDAGWLKSCLLYWDRMSTLAAPGDPKPYKNDDSREFATLGVLVPEYPSVWSMDDAARIISELMTAKQWSAILGRSRNRRIASLRELYVPFEYQLWSSTLHDNPALRIKNWDRLDRNTATLYLTALSAIMADYHGQALVTDKPGLRALAESVRLGYPLSEAIELDGTALPPAPKSHRLTTADAETALGMRITFKSLRIDPATAPSKIISFREKYRDELGRFRVEVGNLAASMSGDYPSFAAFEQAVADLYRNAVEPSISSLDKALRGQRIVSQISLFSVGSLASAPALLTQTVGSLGTSIGLIVGGALAVNLQIAKSRAKMNKILSENPYSYVVHAPRSFKQR